MLAQEYYRFRQDLQEKGIIMSFSGGVSESVLLSLGDTLKRQIRHEDVDARTEKRVFSVFVELVQNIIRYSADAIADDRDEADLASGLISVGMKDQQFFVVCANTVRREDVAGLREKLDELRGMDREALRAYYKKKLREPADADSKGASLGLIEIARRASEPIEFDFVDVDDGTAFFSLKACI